MPTGVYIAVAPVPWTQSLISKNPWDMATYKRRFDGEANRMGALPITT